MATSHSLTGLYVITDARLCAQRGLAHCVREALEGGARLVQYRDKSGDHRRRLDEVRQLVELCEQYGRPLIVNDDVTLARTGGAHGVHLGRDDVTVETARHELGEAAIIGYSCYNQLDRARRGAQSGADYLAFGSVFPSRVKPDAVHAPLQLFQQARPLGLPLCAIGGIDQQGIGDVAAAGGDMAAVISAVFAADDIREAVRELSEAFTAAR